jgi:hypothetical protein
MTEEKKTPKKRHYDTKLPCPSCGERIGFVESTCPFCEERIPFTSDKAGKVLFGLGAFLALGYLFSVFYFWEEGGMYLGSIGRGIGMMIFALVSADRMFRF